MFPQYQGARRNRTRCKRDPVQFKELYYTELAAHTLRMLKNRSMGPVLI